jgi:hypothetical protein
MGCACAGAAPQGWVYTYPDGVTTKDYQTEVEAKAAVIRNGGGTFAVK